MQLEIEKRSILDKAHLGKLKEFLSKNAKVKKEYKRFTFVYLHRQDFISDPDYPIDLKVRFTNGTGELSLKYGDWHGSAGREEYGINFDADQVEDVLGMVRRLEHAWGIVTYLHRVEYDYDGMTVTVDDYFDFDQDIIEVENLVYDEENAKSAEDKIDRFLADRDLQALDSATMQRLVADMNAREKWRFDFTKQDIHEFVEKWNDFILCKK